jgi:polyisoprenoid-binding protein YceI
MAIAVPSRTLADVEIPAAGTWVIDQSHTSVGFLVRHLMVAKVRGRFGEFAGAVRIADRPEDSSVEVEVKTASIDTRDEGRDTHLRSADFFDVQRFPTMSFHGTGLRSTGPRSFELPGELTIKDVTRPVSLAVDYEGLTLDPWGNGRAVFTATTEIDREDFGLTWNVALEAGGVLVGKQIKIEIEVEAVHDPSA